jgi:hypothetical protein
MFLDSFVTTFATAAIGRAVGLKNKRTTGLFFVKNYHFYLGSIICICLVGAIIFGLILIAIFIPLRVPLLTFFGMTQANIEISKWYYIIQFCLLIRILVI